ncbi:MAG: FAD-binding oxidoreductase [Ilumatobacteraceae bacterium]
MSPTGSYDAAVIGGGIAGAACADAIARTGRTVVLLEQEPHVGYHSTGRSAAILSETSGHPVVCGLANASRPFFESPPSDVTEVPLLSPRGLVWIGQSGDEGALDELAAAGSRLAPTVTRVGPAEVLALVPGLREHAAAAGGVHEPDARSIDVSELLAGFVRRARRHGAHVALATEALRLERSGRTWEIDSGTERFRAEVVVDAAGAWADEVARRAGVRPIGARPFRRTVCIVPVGPDVSNWPLVMDVMSRFYAEPDSGGLLVSLAEETLVEPGDARPEELDLALALERLDEATTLAPRSIRRSWAGLRTFSPDRLPTIGPDPDEPSFIWCAGLGGAGIKTAPAVGAIVANGLDPDRAPNGTTAPGARPLDDDPHGDGRLGDGLGRVPFDIGALSPARFR